MTLCSSKAINASQCWALGARPTMSMGSRKRDHGNLQTLIRTYLRLTAVSGESCCCGQPWIMCLTDKSDR